MRVAQLLYSGVGGHGSVAFSLVSGDTRQLWSNLLCFVGTEPLHRVLESKARQREVDYLYVPTSPGRPQKSWRKVFGWLSEQRPDALIVHSATVLFPCLLYGALRNVPVIVVEHTSVAVKRKRDWVLSAAAMLFADRVVLVSEAFAAAMAQRLGSFFRPSKSRVIPNGVDTACFVPAAPHELAGVGWLGMAGRFTSVKKQLFLVDVVHSLQQRAGGIHWRLSLAGDGEELPRVKRRAELIVPDLVSFVGVLDEERLAQWYRSLGVYVHCSEGEALSTSILQAMASALPIVASDVPGIEGQVERDFGFLLPNDDPEQWAAAIETIASDRARSIAMGNKARQCCERLYSDREMHRAYDRLLREARAARGH